MISVSNLLKPQIVHVVNSFHKKSTAAASFGIYTVETGVPDLPIVGAYGFDKTTPLPNPIPEQSTLFLRNDLALTLNQTVSQSYVTLTRIDDDNFSVTVNRGYNGVVKSIFNDVTDSSSDVFTLGFANGNVTYVRISDPSTTTSPYRGSYVNTPGRPGEMIRFYSATLNALSPTGADFTAPYDIIRVSLYFSIFTTSGPSATLTYLTAVKRTGAICSMGTPQAIGPAFTVGTFGLYVESYYKA